MAEITPFLVALKTLSLVLGATITFFAYRAYRRTGAAALGALSLGFAVVTVGALTAGALERLFAVEPTIALTLDSALTALGFAIIVYSLYVE